MTRFTAFVVFWLVMPSVGLGACAPGTECPAQDEMENTVNLLQTGYAVQSVQQKITKHHTGHHQPGHHQQQPSHQPPPPPHGPPLHEHFGGFQPPPNQPPAHENFGGFQPPPNQPTPHGVGGGFQPPPDTAPGANYGHTSGPGTGGDHTAPGPNNGAYYGDPTAPDVNYGVHYENLPYTGGDHTAPGANHGLGTGGDHGAPGTDNGHYEETPHTFGPNTGTEHDFEAPPSGTDTVTGMDQAEGVGEGGVGGGVDLRTIIFGGGNHETVTDATGMLQYMKRPEQIKSTKCNAAGCEECTNYDGCWHGCFGDGDCTEGLGSSGNFNTGAMVVTVPPNSDYSAFEFEAWARCLEPGGEHQNIRIRITERTTQNGKMTIYVNGEEREPAQEYTGQGHDFQIDVEDKDTLVRIKFEPTAKLSLVGEKTIDETETSWARAKIMIEGVAEFTDNCMTAKFCMDKLANGDLGFEVRNSHHFQLMCLGPEEDIDEELRETCDNWTECMKEASEEDMNFLKELLIASTSSPDGGEVVLAQTNVSAKELDEDKCFDPVLSDPERLECDCVEETKKACEDAESLSACIKEMMCKSDGTCYSWKEDHCDPDLLSASSDLLQQRSQRSLLQQRYRSLDGVALGKCNTD